MSFPQKRQGSLIKKKTIQNKKQSIFKSATFPRSIMRCASVCEEYLAYCSSHRKKGSPFVYAPQFRQERPKQLPFPSWEISCPTLKILDDRGFHCFPTVSEFSDKWKLDRNQTHSRLSGIVGDSLENPSQISAITGDHWRGRTLLFIRCRWLL